MTAMYEDRSGRCEACWREAFDNAVDAFLQRLYLPYEDWADWAKRSGRENLATHYVVVAQK